MKSWQIPVVAVTIGVCLGGMSAKAEIITTRLWKNTTPIDEATTGPSSPTVGHQKTQVDSSEVCCEAAGGAPDIIKGAEPCRSFAPAALGGGITFNTYWTDVMPEPIPASWIVDWTLVLQKVFNDPVASAGNVITVFEEEPVDYGDLSGVFEPGDVVTFCVAGLVELPNISQLDDSIVRTGLGVTTPTGTIPTEFLGAFSIGAVPVP